MVAEHQPGNPKAMVDALQGGQTALELSIPMMEVALLMEQGIVHQPGTPVPKLLHMASQMASQLDPRRPHT